MHPWRYFDFSRAQMLVPFHPKARAVKTEMFGIQCHVSLYGAETIFWTEDIFRERRFAEKKHFNQVLRFTTTG